LLRCRAEGAAVGAVLGLGVTFASNPEICTDKEGP